MIEFDYFGALSKKKRVHVPVAPQPTLRIWAQRWRWSLAGD